MKKYINWNNKRRRLQYWISIGLLISIVINIDFAFEIEEYPLIRIITNIMYDFYEIFLHSIMYLGLASRLFTVLSLNFIIIGVIAIFNHLIGMLPNAKLLKVKIKYTFIGKNAFIGDIFIGVILEVFSLNSLFKFMERYTIMSIVVWLYSGLFIIGSLLYWKNIIPLKQYLKIISLLKNNLEYENIAWYCITNSTSRLSTFDRVPWKGKVNEILLDEKDLEINKRIKVFYFKYYN